MSEPKIVIGAGAAGLTAAAVCAERGGRVLLIEKMERPGRKLRITGKGRCNVTNATFDLQGLLEHIPTNPRFLYSAFSNFMPYDTIALLEDLGVPTKIERGERVFPVSDHATDIVDALVRRAKNAGVQFLQGTVERLELTEDGRRVQAVHLTDGPATALPYVPAGVVILLPALPATATPLPASAATPLCLFVRRWCRWCVIIILSRSCKD